MRSDALHLGAVCACYILCATPVSKAARAHTLVFPLAASMLLPNLARLDLRCRLEECTIGGDADPRKRPPPTAEEKETNKAARQERKDAAKAAADAARTVDAIEAELKKAELDILFVTEDEEEDERLSRTIQALKKELEDKKKSAKQPEEKPPTFTAEKIHEALDALMPQLENDDIGDAVAALRALLNTYAERIMDLQRQEAAAKLSPIEKRELVALREANASIRVGVAAAKIAAPKRKEKRERRGRRQEALDAVKKPWTHLKTSGDKTWWKKDGERVWNKLRARAEEDEKLPKGAASDGSDAAPSVQEEVIDLTKIPGTSNKEKAAALTRQLQALGTRAIKAMTDDIASENSDKGGNPYDGYDDSDDEDQM